jgi:transcriptional regulator GlxA family with amidase domain
MLVFDGVDLIDVSGPLEVLWTANRLAQRRGEVAPFEVRTASLDGRSVTTHGGVGLTPHAALDDVGDGVDVDVDVLMVPGAIDIDGVLTDPALIDAARTAAARGVIVTSICTGAFVLGAAGLLDHRPFTTHVEDLADLARRVGTGTPDDTVRWVDAGDVITAGGMTSGIAAALHLVARLVDHDLADATARQMDYAWSSTRAT